MVNKHIASSFFGSERCPPSKFCCDNDGRGWKRKVNCSLGALVSFLVKLGYAVERTTRTYKKLFGVSLGKASDLARCCHEGNAVLNLQTRPRDSNIYGTTHVVCLADPRTRQALPVRQGRNVARGISCPKPRKKGSRKGIPWFGARHLVASSRGPSRNLRPH